MFENFIILGLFLSKLVFIAIEQMIVMKICLSRDTTVGINYQL